MNVRDAPVVARDCDIARVLFPALKFLGVRGERDKNEREKQDELLHFREPPVKWSRIINNKIGLLASSET